MGADTLDYCGIIPKDLATGALWPQIGALIAAAMPYGRGEYDLDDIRAGIERVFAAPIGNSRRNQRTDLRPERADCQVLRDHAAIVHAAMVRVVPLWGCP
jgi:hypothetical protein